MHNIEIGTPLNFETGIGNSTFCVDRFINIDGLSFISGWKYNCEIDSCGLDQYDSEFAISRYFPRPDVAAGFILDNNLVQGFFVIGSAMAPKQLLFNLRIGSDTHPVALSALGAKPFATDIASDLLRDYKNYIGLLHNYLKGSLIWLKALARTAPELSHGADAKGHLELARGIGDIGGLVIGWTISQGSSLMYLLSESGVGSSIDNAARWNRPDIVEAFSATHGSSSQFAGFLNSHKGPLLYGEKLYLLAAEGDRMHRVGETLWEPAPKDPLSFARWAFEYPTPMTKFYERLNKHDGPILEELIRRNKTDTNRRPFEVTHYGNVNQSPLCSMIIPLYRRYDFMRNQLLELSTDDFIRENCELIYVLDDPLLADALRASAPVFLDSYHIPFQVVYSDVNRGFAGATNVGVSLAKAPLTLLLNSDVIPIEEGWLQAMIEQLQCDKSTGIVGSRLLFANGAIQHDGMCFSWEPSWHCHLNKHPNAGMDPANLHTPMITTERAVTAACMLLRTEEFEKIGALDDQFLIGDFEDSDICLKIAQEGLSIKCVHHDKLTHLERQSFSSLGTNSFRDKVARYNAWRHERRWGDKIRAADLGTEKAEL